MFKISKEYHFSASHVLKGLPDDHPCSRLHGHNYIVKIELSSDSLTPPGFVVDYRSLDALKHFIDTEIDHRHLNDIFGDHSVTSELLAKFFYDWCKSRWPQVSAVSVSETARTWAEYRP